jgi:hypothetical protein
VRDEIFEFVGSVLFDPGHVINRSGCKGWDFGVV